MYVSDIQLACCNKLRRQTLETYMEDLRSKHDPSDAQLAARPPLNHEGKSYRDCHTRRFRNPTAFVQNWLSAKTNALDVCMSWRRSHSTCLQNIIWTCTAAAFIPPELHRLSNTNCIIMPWSLHLSVATHRNMHALWFLLYANWLYAPVCVARRWICTPTNRYFLESSLTWTCTTMQQPFPAAILLKDILIQRLIAAC